MDELWLLDSRASSNTSFKYESVLTWGSADQVPFSSGTAVSTHRALCKLASAQCERWPVKLLPHSVEEKTWIRWAAWSHSAASARTGWSVLFSPSLWCGKIRMTGLSFPILTGDIFSPVWKFSLYVLGSGGHLETNVSSTGFKVFQPLWILGYLLDTQISRISRSFYLRDVISDYLLIGFIRATETLKKNWNKKFDIRIDDNSSK